MKTQMVSWCCRKGLNFRPLPYQGSALPLTGAAVLSEKHSASSPRFVSGLNGSLDEGRSESLFVRATEHIAIFVQTIDFAHLCHNSRPQHAVFFGVRPDNQISA